MRVIDTNSKVTSSAISAMRAQGVTGVLRYLGKWPSGKGTDAAEVKLIRDAGLSLALIYESTADQMLVGDGMQDATKAQVELSKLGLAAAFVWFACDTDIGSAQAPRVMKYLDRAASVIGGHRVGIYGGFNVCQAAIDRGYLGWQTYAFSGNHGGTWVKKEPRCSLWQHNEWGKVWGDLGGMDYDANEVNPSKSWGAIGVAPVIPPTIPEVPVTANVKQQQYLKYLNGAADNPDAKDEYLWGAEGESDRDHDGHAEADCSGLFHAALTRGAGISDSRTTADGYKNRGHRIDKPTQIGDYGVLLNANGTAHHIGMYTGSGNVVEAKGAAYGILRTSVSAFNGRGAVWYRIDAINAQMASPAAPPAPATPATPFPPTPKDADVLADTVVTNETGASRRGTIYKGDVVGIGAKNASGLYAVYHKGANLRGWALGDHLKVRAS